MASFPLSYYSNCSFYTLRTDARDRFGKPLEQRFSRDQIRQMCINSGLVDLFFLHGLHTGVCLDLRPAKQFV